MDSKPILCPICNSGDYEVVFSGKGRWGWEITNVVCLSCGLVYQNPRPTAKALDRYYKEKYRFKSVHPENITEDYLKTFARRRAHYVPLALQKYTDLEKDSRVLEVGFGIGAVIFALSEAGYTNITGMDSSITHEQFLVLQNIWECRNHKLFKAKFEIFLQGWKELNGDRFNLVILHHVLEHVPWPIQALSSCITVLQPEGYIFVAVPDVFWPRNGWNKFFVMPHLATYCQETLDYLWQMLGFQRIASGYWHKSVWNILKIGQAKHKIDYDESLAQRTIDWIRSTPGELRCREVIPDEALNFPL